MKLYIKKISSLLLLTLFFVLNACEDEESLVMTTPSPVFVLQEPAINSVYLNFALSQNPALTVTWNDEVTNSTNYTVEMSLTEAFTTAIPLGTTASKQFTISVANLNAAIISAGATNFKDITIYVRIKAGSAVSNSVIYFVTTYPTNPPVITSPAANAGFVLSIGSTTAVVLTTNWTDTVLGSDLGLTINYAVEAALAGTNFASPVALGTVTNLATLATTHGDLNAVALGLGMTPGVAGNVDLRIKATNTNQGGAILTRTSLPVTISITPYSVSFPNLFFVGDATTPGWNNNNNNTPVFRDQNVPNKYTFTGYFGAGAFKLLEVKGQWQPQWGTNSAGTLAVNPGGGSDPGTFNVASAGYYTYTFTTVGQGGSYTVAPFDASSSTTYTTMGIIGAATANGWGSDTFMTQDPNNPHLWFINGVTLTAGQFKFRANSDWGSNWGDNGSTQNYGTALFNAPNNISIATAGTYSIWFNDLDRSYIIIAQ
jgi:hypothetical protein